MRRAGAAGEAWATRRMHDAALAPSPSLSRWHLPLPPPNHGRGHLQRGESKSGWSKAIVTIRVTGGPSAVRQQAQASPASGLPSPLLYCRLLHLLSSAAAVAAALISLAPLPFVHRFCRW